MKRNGMCPICYFKKLFTKPAMISDLRKKPPYENNVAKTPPMGWSSWNTFKNKINQNLIYETALAMKEKGLADCGYQYINLDDNWHSSMRDDNGALQGDLTSFSEGIPALIAKINALGLKVGVYSSNGTHTCEDLPASLGHERQDALTFARWGVEFFKYDFCHNIPISSYAPLVNSIDIALAGEQNATEYLCTTAKLSGTAKLMPDNNVSSAHIVSGLDSNAGAMLYDNVTVAEDGEYTLTINIRKKGAYEKYLLAEINDTDTYGFTVPSQNYWNYTAKFQRIVSLKKGTNTIKLFNPIATRADSAMIQYRNMAKELAWATKQVARDTQTAEKPICFSICEWGKNEPHKWGASAGNLWRTTGDISANWMRILQIYDATVGLYEYAGVGHWNDPDMLEVGNGKLSYDENISHFSLWCMMASPLILGNDLRTMPKNIVEIVTNRNLIAINQDELGRPAKRISCGLLDILARPLSDGSVAVSFFNKMEIGTNVNFDIRKLCEDSYTSLTNKASYTVTDMWSNEITANVTSISTAVKSHGVKVYKII